MLKYQPLLIEMSSLFNINESIGAGNRHDSLIIPLNKGHVNHELIDTESKRVSKNNKYKQFVLGDAGYFSENLKRKFDKQQKILLTDVNKKNTKDEAKLKILIKQKRKYQNPAQRVKQKKRLVIERSFAWLKFYSKMNKVIEKTIKSFAGLMLLAHPFCDCRYPRNSFHIN